MARKEGEVIEVVVVSLDGGNGDHLAIRVARMIHETCRRAELLTIHHVSAFAVPIKIKKVGLILQRNHLANPRLLLGNDFA